MFIVYGTSYKYTLIAKRKEMYQCPHCNQVSEYGIYKSRSFFTLFWFIKLFPTGKEQYIYMCPKCKNGYVIGKQNINDILSLVENTPLLQSTLNDPKFLDQIKVN